MIEWERVSITSDIRLRMVAFTHTVHTEKYSASLKVI
jgi:hypothetical protein